jgi:hypothetical protein
MCDSREATAQDRYGQAYSCPLDDGLCVTVPAWLPSPWDLLCVYVHDLRPRSWRQCHGSDRIRVFFLLGDVVARRTAGPGT